MVFGRDRIHNWKASTFRLDANLLREDFAEAASTQLLGVALSAIKPPTEENGKYIVVVLKPIAERLQRIYWRPPAVSQEIRGLTFIPHWVSYCQRLECRLAITVLSLAQLRPTERRWRNCPASAGGSDRPCCSSGCGRRLAAARYWRNWPDNASSSLPPSAAFLTVLHRLFVSGSDRAAEKWRADYQIDGAEGLQLHHLYRTMAWLGEPLADQTGASELAPRCHKDIVEEEPFARRHDLFAELSVVFMDTTSLSFEAQGGADALSATAVPSRAIPCSAAPQQRHKIIRNGVALVGQESVSGVTAEPPPHQSGAPTHARLYHR